MFIEEVMRELALAAALFVVAGCSASVDTKAAEQAVARFHQMLDAGQFEAMYAASADDLRKSAAQRDFIALLEAVHRKLGNTGAATEQKWNINYHTSGTFVTLAYSTRYAAGEAAEQFVYRMQDGQALLVGYHINSNALILN